MIKVGITGGIGSGKSTVCEIFKKFGTPVFDSDKIAKEQYTKPKVKEAVSKALGDGVLTDGEVDMDKLRKTLFKDKGKLEKISNIIHPALLEDYELFCNRHCGNIYCLFESAIIFERKLSHLFDKMITVVADKNTRIKRVMERNPLITIEEVADRIKHQLGDKYKIAKSDFVIKNNGEDLYAQTQKVHNDIIRN